MRDRVHNLAHQHNIDVFYFPMSVKALAMTVRGRNSVCIDPVRMSNLAEECTSIIHELGHFETGTLYMPDNPLDCHSRHELRAWRWAIRYMLPPSKLRAMLARSAGPWEVAEELCVTEDFVRMACDYYSSSGIM